VIKVPLPSSSSIPGIIVLWSDNSGIGRRQKNSLAVTLEKRQKEDLSKKARTVSQSYSLIDKEKGKQHSSSSQGSG